MAITYRGPVWDDHVSGYEVATFPVMPDVDGEVYHLYGANTYDIFLVDKKGRLAKRFVAFYDDVQIPDIQNALRDLYTEEAE